MQLPAPIGLLRGATLPDGRTVDVRLDAGRVSSVTPSAAVPGQAGELGGRTGQADEGVLDLSGFLLLTAPVDPHAHLDKARSWAAIRPPMGDLLCAIGAWRAYAATMTEDDVADRALSQALAMLAAGTTAIRSHVDVLRGSDPMRCARALVAVREQLSGLLDLELVVLAGPDTPDPFVTEALDLGLDLVGGAPHLAADPSADLHRLLRLAADRGCGVDLHTDESLDGPVTLDELARAVRGWTVNVSAGHCSRLGTLPAQRRAEVIAEVIASDVGVIANPITNLYLQGWEHATATPRGLTAAAELLAAGARFAAGADNVRDPFNPLGRSDALETAMLLVTAAHLSVDEAWRAVSDGARALLGLPEAGAVVGAQADLLAVRGTHLAEVVAEAPPDRYVLHAGRLVSATVSTTHRAAPELRRHREEVLSG